MNDEAMITIAVVLIGVISWAVVQWFDNLKSKESVPTWGDSKAKEIKDSLNTDSDKEVGQ